MRGVRESWKESLIAFALLAGAATAGFATQTPEPVAPAPRVSRALLAAAAAPSGPQPHRVMTRPGTRYPVDGTLKPGGKLERKLEAILFDEVMFEGVLLPEVLQDLNEECQRRDPEKRGVNFLINPNTTAIPAPPLIDPVTGQLVPLPPAEPVDMNSVLVRFNLPLRQVRLRDVLDAVVKVADRPIRYSVEDYAVVFSQGTATVAPDARPPTPPAFLTVRTLQLPAETLAPGLENAFAITLEPAPEPGGPARTRQLRTALRQLLTQIGVDLDVPGKALFYNELTGVLMVRATPEDLDLVQAAVVTLGGSVHAPTFAPAPQGVDLGEAPSPP